MTVVDAARQGRVAFFAMLADGEHWLELRCRHREGRWAKHWARTPEDADELSHAYTRAGQDVYVGLAPRLGRTGDDQRRYAPLCMLWADLDRARSVDKLDLFEPEPTAVVLSGGVDGDTPKRHTYWRLTEPLPADRARGHLRRLAAHLEADMASTDAARVLRVPGSRHHGTGRVAVLERFTGEAHTLADLTGDLPDTAPVRVGHSNGQARIVPVHERHRALVSLLGTMRRWGAGVEVLEAATRAFCAHQCAHDPAVPLDIEHALSAARSVGRYPAGPAKPWDAR